MHAGWRQRPRAGPFLVALAVALAGSGCASRPSSTTPVPLCLPEFPYAQGWLGGDGAYSVSLPGAAAEAHRETLWLFGDSFVGEPTQSDRHGARFVHNTIAFSRCSKRGEWQIDYHWHTDESGEPRALFDSDTEKTYYWLFDGFFHADVLYVGLLEVSDSPPDETLGLGFRLTGMKLARVENWRDDPGLWRIEVRSLSRSQRAFPSSALVVDGGYLHLFAFQETDDGGQPRFLTRLPLRSVEAFGADLARDLETFVGGARGWQPGLLPDSAVVLMDDNATEMSVEYDAETSNWLAVYGSPLQTGPAAAGSLSDRVYLRTAPRLEGPWSARSLLYVIPELQPDHLGGHDPDTLCYAAKAHRAFSPPGRLLLTYVCNLASRENDDPWQILARLERNMKLYRPQPVLLPLP